MPSEPNSDVNRSELFDFLDSELIRLESALDIRPFRIYEATVGSGILLIGPPLLIGPTACQRYLEKCGLTMRQFETFQASQ